MPFMVNVNRLSLYVGIPLLLVIYLVYVLGSFFFYDDQGRQQAIDSHYENVATKSDINALILGGSNAVYSLSAEMLTDQTPFRFYNASIVNEGFGTRNYFGFIDDLITDEQAEKTKLVIYSSVLFVRSVTNIPGFEDEILDILGQRNYPQLLPEKTFARFLIDQLKPSKSVSRSYGSITSLGDFDFERFICEYNASLEAEFEAPSFDEVSKWIYERQSFVQTKFPNAQVIMVFPLEFDANPTLRNQYFDQIGSKLKEEGVEYVIQRSTQDTSLICDAKHHANDKGRMVRTNDLIKQLLEKLLKQRNQV